MGRLNKANLKRTLYYLKRNGLRNTFYAAKERLETAEENYSYQELTKQELTAQREKSWDNPIVFSIIVPLYHTPWEYLKEMVESVLEQSYPYLELILADATEDNRLELLLKAYEDKRLRYYKLSANQGIADNTNAGIELATGQYIGLLDHDDVLTPDALYEMALRIEQEAGKGVAVRLLYSDEDKCNQDRTRYYEPHFKEDFNLELLLCNNYICHFTVMEAELMKRLKLRREFDGAQDFDLVLRAAAELSDREGAIQHIPKVLYHWRCHTNSTAENPASKEYAYQAGERAVKAFVRQKGWKAESFSRKHLGFYGIRYLPDIVSVRPEVGAVGGRLVQKGRVAGGIYRQDGTVLYQGLSVHYSGYMHRAVLTQEAEAVDIRLMQINPCCYDLFQQVTGASYKVGADGISFAADTLPEDTDYKALSLKLCQALRETGYHIVWEPSWSRRIRE